MERPNWMSSREHRLCKQAAVNKAISVLPSFNLGTYSASLCFQKNKKLSYRLETGRQQRISL